jgi:hypothetical protein
MMRMRKRKRLLRRRRRRNPTRVDWPLLSSRQLDPKYFSGLTDTYWHRLIPSTYPAGSRDTKRPSIGSYQRFRIRLRPVGWS